MRDGVHPRLSYEAHRADQFLETMTGHGTVIQRARCLARRALCPAASETAPMHSAITRRTLQTETAAAMQAGDESGGQGQNMSSCTVHTHATSTTTNWQQECSQEYSTRENCIHSTVSTI
ncbi:hypothetical protein CBL_04031 [Carabus blaptoides fortunei]